MCLNLKCALHAESSKRSCDRDRCDANNDGDRCVVPIVDKLLVNGQTASLRTCLKIEIIVLSLIQ